MTTDREKLTDMSSRYSDARLFIHADSHLDHGLTPAQVDYVVRLFGDRTAFFRETITLPPELGTVPCGLYGPRAGDVPVPESAVHYAPRPPRTYDSRLVSWPLRDVREVTVVGGPHDGHPCVLYTAFGGVAAEREPGDPTLPDEARAASEAFWRDHALVG